MSENNPWHAHWMVGSLKIHKWVGYFGIILALILIVGVMSGCSTAKPYAEISLGYQLDGMTDYWLKTSNPDQCSRNVQFNGEVGLEFPHNWQLGYHHQSWLLCGGPFNHRPEIYTDDIRLTKKWGGR